MSISGNIYELEGINEVHSLHDFKPRMKSIFLKIYVCIYYMLNAIIHAGEAAWLSIQSG